MREIREIPCRYGWMRLFLKEAGIHADIMVLLLQENAVIKGETICELTGEITLA